MDHRRSERSIPEIVGDLLTQFPSLARKESQLARAEISEKITGFRPGVHSASKLQDPARETADSMTASKTYGVAADQARRVGDKVQEAASGVRGKVAAGGRSIMDYIYEQPLVIVGLGFALGAAIGAASPSTEVEDELMDESSDAVKEETADLAKEHLKKGQAVAERAWLSASEGAEKQGLVSSFP